MTFGTAFGAGPWGGAATTSNGWGISSVAAVRENCIRVTFVSPIYWSDWRDPFDGADSARYSVTPVAESIDESGEPARPVFVASVELVSPTEVDVWLDRSMSAFGARYLVEVAGLRSKTGVVISSDLSSGEVFGVRRGSIARMPDLAVDNRDFANPQSLSAVVQSLSDTTDSAILGTYQVDESGDYATDSGLVSLRKRIVRRLTTRRGTLLHSPTYGVAIPAAVKKLATSSLLASLASDAEDQIRQEPEVTSVRVRVDVVDGGLYRFRVVAKTTIGTFPDLLVPIPGLTVE